MAKKKESIYTNWEEIDQQMRKIGELEIKKTKPEGEMNIKVNELKNKYGKQCNELSEEIKTIKTEITRFCDQKKDEFLDKRSKKLTFGTVAYRLSESVKFLNKEASIIKSLMSLNCDFCLRTKTEIDKEQVKTLDNNILAKIGVAIVKKDKLTIEPDNVKIAASIN